MKKYILLVTTLFFGTLVAQNVNYDQIEEKVVEQALQTNPTLKISALKTEIAHKEIGIARSAWAEQIVGQVNFNEANINPSATNGANLFYPRYLVGLRVTLGTFFKVPLQTQKAKLSEQIATKEGEIAQNEFRAEVKRRFRLCVAQRHNFLLRKRMTDEFQIQLNVITKKYNNKEVTFDEYFKITSQFVTTQELLNTAEAQMYVAKYNLEEIVGSTVVIPD